MQLLQFELLWLGQVLDCGSPSICCRVLVARSCFYAKDWEAGASGRRPTARSPAYKLSLNRFLANYRQLGYRLPPQSFKTS